MEPVTEPAPLATFLVAEPAREGDALPELAAKALHAIRTHLGMDVAFVSEFEAGQRVFRYVHAAYEDSPVVVGVGNPLEESYCQRVVDGRLPELIRDARTIPAALELPATTALPVGAHLSVPIRLDDGRVYGTFCCFSSVPNHTLNDRDVAVMRVFADLIADQIDRDSRADRRRRETLDRLEAVIAGDGLSMVYQPIVDLRRQRPLGWEALARFAGDRPCGPDVWFREASEVGLGVELELAAVHAALAVLPGLPTDAYLSINASPATVVSGELARALESVPLDRVVVEVTEHEAISAYDELTKALGPLQKRGLRVAVDDAGAGYATFRHILRLKPDIIKLDMAITRDIDQDPARRALATALIAFARDTGSVLVAEGVETDGELDALRSLGITVAQGYHLGRPGPLFVDPAAAPRGTESRRRHPSPASRY
jgi:EAL domain-containing protein (putative c-di-GMP-specific phosphodiesterase class I)